MQQTLERYQALLQTLDRWFAGCIERAGDQIRCHKGCSSCCRVYAQRPMTCRLHGLPNIDVSGESFSDEFCTLNFSSRDPLTMTELRHPFREPFATEFDLLARFSAERFGQPQLELDTFIPSALQIDFEQPG